MRAPGHVHQWSSPAHGRRETYHHKKIMDGIFFTTALGNFSAHWMCPKLSKSGIIGSKIFTATGLKLLRDKRRENRMKT